MDRLTALRHYTTAYRTELARLDGYRPSAQFLRTAREWMEAGVAADQAAAWTSLGYLPGEAAPLIAQGITPQMADAVEDAEVAVDGGREAHVRAVVLRMAEREPGLIIDPDLADRLGLDERMAKTPRGRRRPIVDTPGMENEMTESTQYYADAAWDSGSITVLAASENGGPDTSITVGQLEWVDPDDDSTEAHDQRRRVIGDALAALGWEPVPDAEWPHIEGGLGAEAGAERVPVQPITSR